MEQRGSIRKERNLSFDVMNILACIGVIALHHNGYVHGYDGGSIAWVQSLVVECLFYCSVPVFMMLSGANLLGYRERYGTAEFLKKRFLRTVVPWLFWSVVFLIWKLSNNTLKIGAVTWRTCADAILNSKVIPSYWFFPALFTCYLAIPVLSTVRNNRKLLWYIAGINFLYFSCKPVAETWLNLRWSFDAPLGGTLLIFVVLGYLLSTEPPERKTRVILYILGAAGVLFRFFYTWYWSVQTGVTDVSIKGYQIFHSVLFSCAVFVAGCRIPWNRILPKWLQKQIPDMAACSFGIYLIHRTVMEYESQWLGLGNNRWSWRTLCIPLTYLVCLGIIKLIRRIPGLRILAGG